MDDRSAKAQRLNLFRNKMPRLSQRALYAVCCAARDGDLPDITKRYEIKEAIDKWALQTTPYGPVVVSREFKLKSALTIDAEVANPLSLMHAAAKCKMFSKLIRDTWLVKPSSLDSPWSLVIYSDGAMPGNKIKYQNKRAVENIYVSFLEFGPAALCKEEFWLPIATMRKTVVETLDAGVSQLMAALLKLCFDSQGHHLQNTGVTLQVPGFGVIKVFAALECILADELALHSLWLYKGSSGLKCCIECMYIYNPIWVHADLVEDTDDYIAYDTTTDLCKCKQHTTATIRAIYQSLADAKPALTADEFAAKETRLGFTYNPNSLLGDPDLKDVIFPDRQNTYDWSHNILQGVFQVTLWSVLTHLKASWPRGLHPLKSLGDYLSKWTLAWRLQSRAAMGEVFNKKRVRSCLDAKCIKCYNSEALSMHAVICHWLRTVVLSKPALAAHHAACKVFLNLSLVISMLWHGARLGITGEMLAAASTNFFKSYLDVFGNDSIIWKFHGMLHHSKYVKQYGWVPHTLPLERKHKMVLGLADGRANDVCMDHLLREVIAISLAGLEQSDWLNLDVGLINPKPPSKALLAWLDAWIDGPHLVSAEARFSKYECCHKGDIAAIKGSFNEPPWWCGRVLFHGLSSGVSYTAVMPFHRQDTLPNDRQETWSTWAEGQEPVLVFLEDLQEVLTYSKTGNMFVVLHPLSLYGK